MFQKPLTKGSRVGGGALPSWTPGLSQSKGSEFPPVFGNAAKEENEREQMSPMKRLLFEERPSSSYSSARTPPYYSADKRAMDWQQARQLESMKKRVNMVLKRSELRRQQSADEAAARRRSAGKHVRAPRDEEITAPMINLVLEDGTTDGIHPLSQVLGSMDRALFTLMVVDPSTSPPICRIYSRKILYERERQAKKQKSVATKNAKPQRMVMTCAIGDHDFDIKMKKTLELLDKGKRVTVVIEYRRGKRMVEDTREKLGARVMDQLQNKYPIVKPPAIEGPAWSAMFQGKAD
ncbi:hypothetical protein EV175_003624 [Coemansia sp. RSA 1933]|nr:hypothetical protein EV175_003624 [Coemansia sp. RSA 1933]